MGFPGSSAGEESTCNAGHPCLIPGSGRSTGERIGYPLHEYVGFPAGSAGKESTSNVGVQFSSVSQSCSTLCDPTDCSTPGLPVHHQFLEFTQIYVHWVGDAIQPSHPLSSTSPLPSTFPRFRVFPNDWVLCIRWPKYWSFSFSISPSSEHPGLISFRMDWLDLLAVQRTLKNLLQHHSSKASILWCSAMQKTWIQSLGWEDPLAKGTAIYFSNLAWRIPWTILGVAKSWTLLSDFHLTSFILIVLNIYLEISVTFLIKFRF